MQNFNIRKGEKSDIEQVFKLIKDLAFFEKAPEAVKNTPEKMLIDAFGKHPIFHFLVAEVNKKVVGVAVFFISYSTWKGKSAYLDDIVVDENHRAKGIGKALMEAFFKQAREWDAQMVHWQVLDWNQPAIDFYKKLNAHLDEEWINCKLYKNQF